MTDARCEPPEPSRVGRHYIQKGNEEPCIARWDGERWNEIWLYSLPDIVAAKGWHYLMPVPSPAEIEALIRAAAEAEEVMALVERVPFFDPEHGAEIKALGDRIGYGALMSSASRSWHDVIESQGFAGSQFVAGPCHSTVLATLKLLRAALRPFTQEMPHV